jgi:hypothetical protein
MMKTEMQFINLISNVIPSETYSDNDSSIDLIDVQTKSDLLKIFNVKNLDKDTIKSRLSTFKLQELKDTKDKVFELLKPRKLNEKQINFILELIPAPLGANKEARDIARFQILDTVKYRLERIQITPVGIPDLIIKIKNKFKTSLIEPSSSVGIACSEAISAPITQMTLNTFHTSGSSKNVSAGLEALRELFNVSEVRKNYNMTIQLKNKNYTYDDMFKYRELFSEVKMVDIVKDVAVLQKDKEDTPPWTSLYLMIAQKTLPETEWFLRIKLDVNMMLTYNISMESIIQKIELETAPPDMVIVPSPLSIGIIDIYPDENAIKSSVFEMKSLEPVTSKRTAPSDSDKASKEMIKERNPSKEGGQKKPKAVVKKQEVRFSENSSLLFLNVIVAPLINNIFVSGIPDIKSVFPSSMPIYSIVLEEILVADKWFLALSYTQMKKTGINVSDLKRLLNYIKIDIIEEKLNGIYVTITETDEKGKPKKPSQIITSLLTKSEKEAEETEAKMIKNDVKGYIHPATEFEKLSKYWFVETNGRNFYSIVENEDVDPYTTFSNDIHDTAKVLGIEAARNLLQIEFRNIILGAEEYINSRHILLLVDIMTNTGRIVSLNFIGAKKMQRGALTLATFEQSMNVFETAASFGVKEDINTVSTNIMTGKRFGNGTGFVHVITKEDYIKNIDDIGKRYNLTQEQLEDEIEVDIQDMGANYNLVVEGEDPILPEDFQPIFEKEEQKYVSKGGENLETIEKSLLESILPPFSPIKSKIDELPTSIDYIQTPEILPAPVITSSVKATLNTLTEIPIIAEETNKNVTLTTEIQSKQDELDKDKSVPGTVRKITIKPPTIKKIVPQQKPIELTSQEKPKLIVPSIKKSVEEPSTRLTPATTSIPATTAIPATTVIPSTTVIPATTAIPATTVIPATTAIPATTVIPATTSIPATTAIPSSVSVEDKSAHHKKIMERLNRLKPPTPIKKTVEAPKMIDIGELLEQSKTW